MMCMRKCGRLKRSFPVRIPVHTIHISLAYGLGFGLSDVKGYKQVSHTGGLEGMVTQITMIPELNLRNYCPYKPTGRWRIHFNHQPDQRRLF
jgi:hypothetical protein